PFYNNVSVWNVSCLQHIDNAAKQFTAIAAKYNIPRTIIGESAEHSTGGQNGITNVFISSFYYLYELSQTAYFGVSNVYRQTLMGGYYELISHFTPQPSPNCDYWILYLWKRMIGNAVLQSSMAYDINVRAWIFRSATTFNKNYQYVAVIINFYLWQSVQIDIQVQSQSSYFFDEYHITGKNLTLDYLY
ncbi:hypothetical protein RFI_30920, partial [Reticulomyxa filosa]